MLCVLNKLIFFINLFIILFFFDVFDIININILNHLFNRIIQNIFEISHKNK